MNVLNPTSGFPTWEWCSGLGFEDNDNELTDVFEESLPYDQESDPVEIEDVDYGIFYVDAGENKENYEGKTVSFKGKVLKSRKADADYFVAGRRAMTCCADDTAFIGYVVKWPESPSLEMGEWVKVTAKIKYRNLKIYGGEGPVLYARTVERTDPPEHELVYFT